MSGRVGPLEGVPLSFGFLFGMEDVSAVTAGVTVRGIFRDGFSAVGAFGMLVGLL